MSKISPAETVPQLVKKSSYRPFYITTIIDNFREESEYLTIVDNFDKFITLNGIIALGIAFVFLCISLYSDYSLQYVKNKDGENFYHRFNNFNSLNKSHFLINIIKFILSTIAGYCIYKQFSRRGLFNIQPILSREDLRNLPISRKDAVRRNSKINLDVLVK